MFEVGVDAVGTIAVAGETQLSYTQDAEFFDLMAAVLYEELGATTSLSFGETNFYFYENVGISTRQDFELGVLPFSLYGYHNAWFYFYENVITVPPETVQASVGEAEWGEG